MSARWFLRLSTPILLCLAATAPPVWAAGAAALNEKGNQAYKRTEFDAALKAYTEAQVRSPDSAAIQYNIGNVLYRQQNYQRAAEAYGKALESARGTLARDAIYNLGNARFQVGDYGGAVKAYRGALQLDPKDRDAKRNLEIALSMLKPPPPQGGGQKPDPQQQQDPPPNRSPSASPQTPPPGSQQSAQQELDRKDAERLLEALSQEERDSMDREKKKARQTGEPPAGKDW